jgi:hypothetical protein
MRGPTIAPTLEETLSPDWLTAALATRHPGIRVVAVTVGEVVSRMSTNACFTIETADELEITTALLERLGHAVDDHGAFDVVEALA